MDQGKQINTELKHKAEDVAASVRYDVLEARMAAMTPEERAAFVAKAAEFAEKANAKAKRRHANEIRNRTLSCSTDLMYELYSLDGCDPKAKELYEAMQADGACRGESWDRWYLYMARKHDIDAREHWLEAQKPEEG